VTQTCSLLAPSSAGPPLPRASLLSYAPTFPWRHPVRRSPVLCPSPGVAPLCHFGCSSPRAGRSCSRGGVEVPVAGQGGVVVVLSVPRRASRGRRRRARAQRRTGCPKLVLYSAAFLGFKFCIQIAS
jgi:hypothetical protein